MGTTTPTDSLARYLAPLAKLNKAALQRKYREVFGRPTRSDNVQHLRAAIAKRLYEQAAPPTPKAASAKPPAVAVTANTRRDARLPPIGTVIEREHGDVVHKVRVLEDAFEYRGQRHRSLSSIAKEITGTVWNGFAFFGLTEKKSRQESAR